MELFTTWLAGRTEASIERESPRQKTQQIAIVGLGYVGLPTALALHKAGRSVLGIDISEKRLAEIREGLCDLIPADQERLSQALLDEKRFELTDEAARLAEADAVVICVPTPID